MSEWIVRAVLDGSPGAEFLTGVEDALERAGLGDVSVAAQPQRGQWTVTAGGEADDPAVAWQQLRDALTDTGVDLAALAAVETFTLAEYERRAGEPTLPVLVGATEVADLLEVTRQRVHQLRSLPAFPAPLVEVAMGPLWDERAVVAFARGWSRKPGRPAKTSLIDDSADAYALPGGN